VWKLISQDPLLSALGGSATDAEAYLLSTPSRAWQCPQEMSLDPRLLNEPTSRSSVILAAQVTHSPYNSPPHEFPPTPSGSSLSSPSSSSAFSPSDTLDTPISGVAGCVPVPNGPEREDGLDNPRPVITADHRLACPACGRVFKSRKDLDRHFNSLHSTDPASRFQCRCGKLFPRKDNYIRHAEKCREPTTSCFRCVCGASTHDLSTHLQHVASWRPRQSCA
jgi:uncharacterized C2H2 Zn-finger protein